MQVKLNTAVHIQFNFSIVDSHHVPLRPSASIYSMQMTNRWNEEMIGNQKLWIILHHPHIAVGLPKPYAVRGHSINSSLSQSTAAIKYINQKLIINNNHNFSSGHLIIQSHFTCNRHFPPSFTMDSPRNSPFEVQIECPLDVGNHFISFSCE